MSNEKLEAGLASRLTLELDTGIAMDTIRLLVEIEQLKIENKELRLDAERYRWLKDKSGNAYVGIYKDDLRGKAWVSGAYAESLVDFAMQTSKDLNAITV